MRAWIYIVFFLSGFAALLYQVVWQRALYSIYGINIESVTMVVTAFMLGLGVGSIAGGAVSKNPKRPVLLMFALVELGIGLFGAVSLSVFHAVGEVTLAMSPVATFFVTFLLVLVPTLLMGSTLPLLVAHLVRSSGNVGKSVGTLYFVNTLGSAFASAAAVLWVLGHAGQTGSVRAAAVLNLTVSLLAYVAHRRSQRPKEIAEALAGVAAKAKAASEELGASEGESAA
jgi:predicted membrane-bound spermidine synthase